MNLTTTYLGFTLPHPLMPGASPLVDDLDMVRRLEDAGAAAIVMHSLFEEQIAAEEHAAGRLAAHGDSFGEALSYLPASPPFALGPDRYLEQLRRIREAVAVPVIASLNGVTAERLARVRAAARAGGRARARAQRLPRADRRRRDRCRRRGPRPRRAARRARRRAPPAGREAVAVLLGARAPGARARRARRRRPRPLQPLLPARHRSRGARGRAGAPAVGLVGAAPAAALARDPARARARPRSRPAAVSTPASTP